MAITEVAETPSTTATHSPPSHFSLPRHFYCAVDRPQFKMETLVDLLGIASRRRGLPMVVCCSSRDELDAVCSAIPGIPSISLDSVHSDLGESERLSIFERFRAAIVKWNQSVSDDQIGGDEENKSHTIVVTDSCLPFVASGELPVSARVLINYELPTKKETYLRRMSTCLAADGIVINMVVGGEVVTLKSVEESINLVIPEMPINRSCEDLIKGKKGLDCILLLSTDEVAVNVPDELKSYGIDFLAVCKKFRHHYDDILCN